MNKRSDIPGYSAGSSSRASSKSGTPPWIWIGVAAVVLVALGIALLLSVGGGSSDLTVGQVQVSGSVLTPYQADQQDPSAGKPSPQVTGTDFAGAPLEIVNNGQPKVLIFLAHWCPVCQREVPVLVAWSEAGGNTEGVEVIGVATGIDRTRSNWPPGDWLRNERWPWPTLVDDADSRTGSVFGLTSFPYFVAIDAQGNIVERVSGEIGGPAFEALLDAARTGVPTTAAGGSGASTPVELPPVG